jgi:general secretion pathway protein F
VASPQGSGNSNITLDELSALNAEISALVRAGVPLESGLEEIGADLPGSLGRLTSIVTRRMKAGESLSDLLDDPSLPFPPVYRAVVKAGLRSGRLSAALDSVARSTRYLAEARRMVLAGLVYPFIVFLVAWALFVFFILMIVPGLARVYDALDLDLGSVFGVLVAWGGSAAIWGPLVPIVVLILFVAWCIRAGRASLVQPRFAGPILGWLPWMGPMLRSAHVATFSEVFALLVENEVPLHEAMLLAAEAVGDPQMIRSAQEIASGLERGEVTSPAQVRHRAFPPLLEWLMRSAGQRNVLLPALRHAAEIYRRRANRQAETARIYLPILLTVVIGGSITLGYALLLFLPWIRFLYSLS